MPICPKCKSSVDDGMKFCTNCGAQIPAAPAPEKKAPTFAPVVPATPGETAVPTPQAEPEMGQTAVLKPPTPPAAPAPTVASRKVKQTAKKKSKTGLILGIVAGVLVLALLACWSFGLFGNEGLFNKPSSSQEDPDEDREDPTEPDVTEPQDTEPPATQPSDPTDPGEAETTAPDATEPDATNPGIVLPDATEDTEPGVTSPGIVLPDATEDTEPNATSPGIVLPDATEDTEPNVTSPGIVLPDTTEDTEPNATSPGIVLPDATEDTEPNATQPGIAVPEPTVPVVAEPRDVELKVWVSVEDQYGSGSWLAQMQAAFEEAHPEYNITWTNETCAANEAGTVVSADASAAADVYIYASDQLGTLVDAGALAPLSVTYRQQVVYDNSVSLLNSVTGSDGNVYGFPVNSNTWFLYYNKSTYSAEDVKSLETMLKKGTVAFPWTEGWYAGTFFLANGCSVFGINGTDASAGIQFGGDKGYAAAQRMIVLNSYANMVCDQDGSGLAGMLDGSVDAFFSGSWNAAVLKEALGDNLGAVQLPTVNIGGKDVSMKAFAGSHALGVNPNCDDQEAAMAFAAFLASEDSQLLRYQLRSIVPAAKDLQSSAEIKGDEIAMAEMNTVANTSVVQPCLPEMEYYWSPMGTFGTAIVNGDITMDNYKEMVDQLVNQMNP